MMSTIWPKQTKLLCNKLGINHPIIQAPMAGGPTTPELVAAVSEAGALGSIGAAYLEPEQIDNTISEIKKHTAKPFAINLFADQPLENDQAASKEVIDILTKYSNQLGVEPPTETAGKLASFEDQIEVVLKHSVPVFSFTFGIPNTDYMKELKRRGIKIIGTATCTDEAKVLQDSGCDIVVAQGIEAGGHRGTFLTSEELPRIGGISLVPQVVDTVEIPVLASGGIMDGRGIVSALSLGASGVQMGTAFLGCREANVHPAWIKALMESSDTSTDLTRAFTGKFARGIRNRFLSEMKSIEDQIPNYPKQSHLTKSIRTAAKAQNNSQFMSLWAGQSSAMFRKSLARELIESLLKECEEVFLSLQER